MKNKIYNFFIIIFISSFFSLASYSIEQFNFDVTNIEILEEGNIFKGTDKGIIKSDNGIIISADTFEYNKALNILNANGNVKIEDTIQDYVIFAEDITYLKNQEKILTKNNSRAIYQKGKTIRLENGRFLNGKEFCGPPRKGESFVYCTDTVFCESAVSLSKNADLLVHESTFSEEDENMAYEKLHSTTIMAAKTALLSNTKKLIITHLSPRYTNKNAITPSDLLKEAQKVFPNTQLAKDFLTAEIK